VNERLKLVSKLRDSFDSRTAYIKAKLGILVPSQIRSLRLQSEMPRQSDLAKAAKLHQSRISMFETPGAANVTVETLAKVAAAFKVGLVVKFVPFHEMLKWENEYSQDTFRVTTIDNDIEFENPDTAVVEDSRQAIAASQQVTNISASVVTTSNTGATSRKPVTSVQATSSSSGIGGA
jgi:transcriptional regulator with XRE-family HTH domain